MKFGVVPGPVSEGVRPDPAVLTVRGWASVPSGHSQYCPLTWGNSWGTLGQSPADPTLPRAGPRNSKVLPRTKAETLSRPAAVALGPPSGTWLPNPVRRRPHKRGGSVAVRYGNGAWTVNTRRALADASLTVAALTHAHWFFGNLYEAVVKVPHRVAASEDTPVLRRTPLGPGSPGRYYAPLAPVAFPAVALALAAARTHSARCGGHRCWPSGTASTPSASRRARSLWQRSIAPGRPA